jgi:hypothetical protein
MYKIFLIYLISIVTLLFPNAWGEPNNKLNPVDETEEDISFSKFKTRLLNAAQKRDVSFIKKILSDDVIYSFGADPERKNAVEGFINHYKLKDGKKSDFWMDLSQAIELGCTKVAESFTCPYVYSKWPDKFDSFSYIAITRKEASIKAQPLVSASKIRSTDYDILKLAKEQNSKGWHVIDLGQGKIGYLPKTEGRSSIDYRVEFIKVANEWKLKYFIAGD